MQHSVWVGGLGRSGNGAEISTRLENKLVYEYQVFIFPVYNKLED
jgi:hypothetical protein